MRSLLQTWTLNLLLSVLKRSLFCSPQLRRMAFVVRRFFSSSSSLARARVATPAPISQMTLLETAELQQLAQKATGPWKQLSKEEVVKLYRASFPKTFKELGKSDGHYAKVIPGVLIGMGVGAWLATFLRKTIGPELPPTFKNAEWEAATKEKLIRQKSNPISGISSNQA